MRALLLPALCAGAASLQPLLDQAGLTYFFVGGKGGVGKTTTSSALATLLAERHVSAESARAHSDYSSYFVAGQVQQFLRFGLHPYI